MQYRILGFVSLPRHLIPPIPDFRADRFDAEKGDELAGM